MKLNQIYIHVFILLILNSSIVKAADDKKWPYKSRISQILQNKNRYGVSNNSKGKDPTTKLPLNPNSIKPPLSKLSEKTDNDYSKSTEFKNLSKLLKYVRLMPKTNQFFVAAYQNLLEQKLHLSKSAYSLDMFDLVKVKKIRIIANKANFNPTILKHIPLLLPNLETLEIIGNNSRNTYPYREWFVFTSEFTENLAICLKESRSIRKLNISNWNMEKEHFLKFIPNTLSLETLDISYSDIDEDIAKSMALNMHFLDTLCLRGCNLTDCSLEYFAMSNPCITNLDISFNSLSTSPSELSELFPLIKHATLDIYNEKLNLFITTEYVYQQNKKI